MKMARDVSVALLLMATCLGAAQTECPLVPVPKVYKDHGKVAELRPREAAIVVGQGAGAPERYAAERLAWLVNRRFKARLPIARESEIPQDRKQLLLLGQRTTNKLLDRLCGAKGIELSGQKPGFDGFVIEIIEDAGRQVAVVGGCNPRGVVYGAHAFFDLLRRDGSRVVFPVVSVGDWPSILWRGRPFWSFRQHLEPGVMDTYVRARVNFIDLRDRPRGKRLYGFPPGYALDVEALGRVVREAHRRGIFVYGTVRGAVSRASHEGVLAIAKRLVELGADGLWISFDDPGSGEDPFGLIGKIIALGRERGIEGWRVAITPPGRSYGRVLTDFNRRAARLPGFGAARWFFTTAPKAQNLKAAQQIGLRRKPSWWHNWPRVEGGFCLAPYVGRSLRADGRPGYVELCHLTPSLPTPWTETQKGFMARLAEGADAVMMWGATPEEYAACVHGLWAWEPGSFDWPRVRAAIHRDVFGPSVGSAAGRFDERLAELKSFFVLPRRTTKPGENWPPRLRQRSDRPRALAMIAELERLLAQLGEKAPGETLLPRERLENVFLEPMKASVDWARAEAGVDYVEYELPPMVRRLGEHLAYGEREAAKQLLEDRRRALLARLPKVVEALAGLRAVEDYAKVWQGRLSSMAYFEELVKRGEAKALAYFASMARAFGLARVCGRMAEWRVPPAGDLLVGSLPREWLRGPKFTSGPVGIGLLELGAERPDPCGILMVGKEIEPGFHGEVEARLAARALRRKAVADLALGSRNLVGTEPPEGVLFRVLAGETELFSIDVSEGCMKRMQWHTFELPAAAAGSQWLTLRLRLEVTKPLEKLGTVVLAGPLRVRAAQ